MYVVIVLSVICLVVTWLGIAANVYHQNAVSEVVLNQFLSWSRLFESRLALTYDLIILKISTFPFSEVEIVA